MHYITFSPPEVARKLMAAISYFQISANKNINNKKQKKYLIKIANKNL